MTNDKAPTTSFRPGSVLLIVIVLLLLLAILGTAYLSTSRNSRVLSAQNVLNADADAQLQGIANAAGGILVDNLNDDFGNLWDKTTTNLPSHVLYRGVYNAAATYNQGDIIADKLTPPNYWVDSLTTALPVPAPVPYTMAGNLPPTNVWLLTTHYPFITNGQVQPWLADRIPQYDSAPYWQNISQALLPFDAGGNAGLLPAPAIATVQVNGGTWTPSLAFESPDGTAMPAPAIANTAYTHVYPTYKTVAGASLNLPALTINGTTVLAGDADGDGIADCLLFPIPGAAFDGLTWYAGIRIIDNNSAINLNTAWSRDWEYPFAAAVPNYFGLFQTSVGLQELVKTNDLPPGPRRPNFLAYRFVGAPAANPTQTPYDEYKYGQPYGAPPGPYPRTDFQFITASDLLYSQLIRRIDNPGWSTNAVRCQPIPAADMVSLAYHFGGGNPNATYPATLSESLLPASLAPITTTQYNGTLGNDVNAWWTNNFGFGSGNSTLPLRCELVTRDPVSNYIAPLYDPYNPGEPILDGLPANLQMMLPYGVGSVSVDPFDHNPVNIVPPPPGTITPPYNHFRGPWSSGTTYYFNDIIIGSDGYTYICVSPTPISGGNSPTLATLPSAVSYQWHLQPWSHNPVKANINSATFPELYRAFWSVMAGNPSNCTPFGYTLPDYNIYDNAPPPTTTNQQYQFRSPLRDPTTNVGTVNVTRLDPTPTDAPPPTAGLPAGVYTNTNTMLLRAALAAVNTLGLRDNSQNVISRNVYLNAMVPAVNPTRPQAVEARVYSSAPQPVITEVYASTYADSADPAAPGTANPKGYVAIELYNPYSIPLILHNWQVSYITRTAATYPNLTIMPLNPPSGATYSAVSIGPMVPMNNPANPAAVAPPDVTIPAGGYALLENYNAGGVAPGGVTANPNDAKYRPASSALPASGLWWGPGTQTNPNTMDVWVTGLQNVIADTGTAVPPASPGGEFVLLRPRRADGVYTNCADPLNTFNEFITGSGLPNPWELVPVDSYDFTNLVQTGPGAPTYNLWSYLRAKGPGQLFKATYPGAYNLKQIYRQVGTQGNGYPIPPVGAYPGFAAWAPSFGTPTVATGNPNNFPPIQIYNIAALANGYMHWPNAVLTPQNANPNWMQQFPFGTFARNGDMLEIPFIGAYRIRTLAQVTANNGSTFLELNSLPMDASMAAVDDGLPLASTIDQVEDIGRFCPMAATRYGVVPAGADFYSFSRGLFRYLTVQSGTSDFLPNFDPGINDVLTYATIPTSVPTAYKYPPAVNAMPANPVFNRDATATDQTAQDNVGVEGLVNINTASWKVLSMLPFVPGNVSANETIAQNIVAYRNQYGPFVSIYDLNKVPGFQTGNTNVNPTTPETGYGLISPPDPTTQFPQISNAAETPGTNTANSPYAIGEDWQGDFAVMTRISNLVTTRSDTFTVYVVIQGWANAGTANAIPKVTRHYAFIADRSAISADPSSRFLKTIAVPND